MKLHVYDDPRYNPTPEEIIARTAEIRATWSDAEYRRRAGMRSDRVEVRRMSMFMESGE